MSSHSAQATGLKTKAAPAAKRGRRPRVDWQGNFLLKLAACGSEPQAAHNLVNLSLVTRAKRRDAAFDALVRAAKRTAVAERLAQQYTEDPSAMRAMRYLAAVRPAWAWAAPPKAKPRRRPSTPPTGANLRLLALRAGVPLV